MALRVVIDPVEKPVVAAPGMLRLGPFEAAVGKADTPQSVMLDIVDDFH